MVFISISFFIMVILAKHGLISFGLISIGYLLGFTGRFTQPLLWGLAVAYFIIATLVDVWAYLAVAP